MDTTNGHGGARKRAGRKTELESHQRTEKRTLTLDDRSIELLKVIGSGNVSKGIRISARAAYDLYQNGRLDPDEN